MTALLICERPECKKAVIPSSAHHGLVCLVFRTVLSVVFGCWGFFASFFLFFFFSGLLPVSTAMFSPDNEHFSVTSPLLCPSHTDKYFLSGGEQGLVSEVVAV